MKTIILIIAIMSLLTSCSTTLPIKVKPQYTGVDPRAQSLLDEYMWLSEQNNIHFYNKVTIGFREIKQGNIVGYCTYGGYFREIDIDTNYWNHSTNMTKLTLLFHELTHCYCGRGHDYEKDHNYPETEAARIARALQWKLEGGDRPGYFEDGCPFSFMYPVVVDDDCVRKHYAEYTKEMFDRCRPF